MSVKDDGAAAATVVAAPATVENVRPKFILSLDWQGHPIGWDTCGNCIRHIRVCECKDGPHEPAYMAKFRVNPADVKPLQKAEEDAEPAKLVLPVIPKAARHESGRKIRSDKGKPRAKKEASEADIAAVKASAEELSKAVKGK